MIEIHLILIQSCQISILEIASLLFIDSNVDLPTNWRELNLIDLVDFEPGSTRVPNNFESEGTSDNA